jgi:uncharacterized membrane-anchored protein
VTKKLKTKTSIDPTLPFESVAQPRRRRKNVPVRPTEDELTTLHQRKAKFGYKSLSKYLIERGLRDGEMIALVDERKVDRLLFEVRKIGVNLNQIARRLNEGKRSYSQEVIDRATRQVAEILAEITGALNK